jgi:threonine/homoserine/homoserine lactone efflux protein
VTLEDDYRRLSRLFPAEWRARHEDELIGTLLDAAEPGRDSVSLAEAADLVRGAAVLRWRDLISRANRTGAAVVAVAAGALALLAGLTLDGVPAEFVLASLVVAAIPGTGVFYTVSSALGGGWRQGLYAAVGGTVGIVPHLLAAMLGLSGVMQAGAVAFETLRWVGVAYLLFVGLTMIRDRGALQVDRPGDVPGAPPERMALVVRRGILINLLNPKLTVFFFAFLPQFLDRPAGVLDPHLAVLGAVFMAATLAVFVVYAWASAAVRDRVLGAPRVLRWVQRSLGTLLIGLAARVAVADR